MNGRRAGARRERLRERARAPETGPARLVRLSRSRYWDVRRIVAGRSELPSLGVAWSRRSSVWSVRAEVARRDDLTPKATRALAVDVPPVRLALAANPQIDAATAALLVRDHDPYVSGVAIGNPRVTAETIRDFTQGMRRPAWTLRRAATNPSCPDDLREELLTWLAVGGAGRDDPLFDPVECTGDPGDGTRLPYQWYRDTIAGTGVPAQHPLWLARSSVAVDVTLDIPQVHDLSVDERRAARVAAAKFKYRKALAALAYDEDEIVRRQARLTLENTPKPVRPLLHRWPVRVAMTAGAVGLVVCALAGLGVLPSAPSSRPVAARPGSPPPATPGSAVPDPHSLVFGAGDERVQLAANSTAAAIPGGFGRTAALTGSPGAPPRTVLRILATGPDAIVVDRIGAVVPGAGEVDDPGASPFSVEPGASRTITVTGAPSPVAFVLHLGTSDRPGLALVPVTAPDPFAEGTTT